MRIIKSQVDNMIALREISGYHPEANFKVDLIRLNYAGETVWATDINGEIRYWDSLAKALNCINDVIRDTDEQKQLLRALI